MIMKFCLLTWITSCYEKTMCHQCSIVFWHHITNNPSLFQSASSFIFSPYNNERWQLMLVCSGRWHFHGTSLAGLFHLESGQCTFVNHGTPHQKACDTQQTWNRRGWLSNGAASRTGSFVRRTRLSVYGLFLRRCKIINPRLFGQFNRKKKPSTQPFSDAVRSLGKRGLIITIRRLALRAVFTCVDNSVWRTDLLEWQTASVALSGGYRWADEWCDPFQRCNRRPLAVLAYDVRTYIFSREKWVFLWSLFTCAEAYTRCV